MLKEYISHKFRMNFQQLQWKEQRKKEDTVND